MTEEKIRALARGFLKKNKLYNFPVNLKKAAEIVGAEIIYEELSPKISGLVIEINDSNYQYLIGININKHFNHRRFTIAHELGHIILNHLKKQQIMCEIGLLNNKNKKIDDFEREANIFASELLVPTDKLKTFLNYNYSEKSLARFFQVSTEVIKYRLINYHYTYTRSVLSSP